MTHRRLVKQPFTGGPPLRVFELARRFAYLRHFHASVAARTQVACHERRQTPQNVFIIVPRCESRLLHQMGVGALR